MSKDLSSLKGVELVDALLSDWPMPERSALEWDDFAERVMSRLDENPEEGLAQATEEVTYGPKILLAPTLNEANTSGAGAPVYHPFAQASGTGRKPRLEETMGAVSQRGDRRSSLQDLAKLANEGPRSQRGGNGPDSFAAAPMSQRSTGRLSEGSGVVDLQSLSVLPEAPSSEIAVPSSMPKSDTFAVTAPVVSQPASAPVEAAPSSLQESIPPMPLSIAPASLSDSGITSPRRMSGPGVGVIAGGIVGVLAVAAGALFFVTTKKGPSASDTAAATTAISTPAEAAKTEAKADTAAVAPVAQVEEAAKPSDGALDPSALPVSGKESAAHESAHHGSSSHHAKDAPVAAVAAPSSKSEKAEKVAAKDAKDSKTKAAEPAAPSGIPDNDLGKAMKQASGGGVVGSGVEKDDASPAFAAGTVPQKPSQGTLTSALGRVMGKAKSCIGPDDPISRASVVFGSAGTVQSVTVSGNAAGKPAEACIKTALSSAKLNTPFAEPTYTTTVTIRP